MLAGAQGGGEAGGLAGIIVAADELGAVVGLPDQVGEVDAVGGEVPLEALGNAGRGATAL